jgi:hypothetical protein
VFVDDIFIVAGTQAACSAGLTELMAYCKRTGIGLKDSKIRLPSQLAQILGVEVDTLRMRICVPAAKRFSIATLAAVTKLAVADGYTLDRNFWLKVCGKLGYVTEVMPSGRSTMPCLWATAYASRTAQLRTDLLPNLGWWITALCNSQRSSERLLVLPLHSTSPLGVHFQSDAAGALSGGFDMEYLMGWWLWDEITAANGVGGLLIRQQEMLPLLAFCRDFVSVGWFEGCLLDYATDNQANAFALNKGRSKDPLVNAQIAEIMRHCATGGADLATAYVIREHNLPSDAMSNVVTRLRAEQLAASYFAGRPLGSSAY